MSNNQQYIKVKLELNEVLVAVLKAETSPYNTLTISDCENANMQLRIGNVYKSNEFVVFNKQNTKISGNTLEVKVSVDSDYELSDYQSASIHLLMNAPIGVDHPQYSEAKKIAYKFYFTKRKERISSGKGVMYDSGNYGSLTWHFEVKLAETNTIKNTVLNRLKKQKYYPYEERNIDFQIQEFKDYTRENKKIKAIAIRFYTPNSGEGGTGAFFTINIFDQELTFYTKDGYNTVFFPTNKTIANSYQDKIANSHEEREKKKKKLSKMIEKNANSKFKCTHYTSSLKNDTIFTTNKDTSERFERGITDTVEIVFPDDKYYYDLLSTDISIKMCLKTEENDKWTFEKCKIYYYESETQGDFEKINIKEKNYKELTELFQTSATINNVYEPPIFLYKKRYITEDKKLKAIALKFHTSTKEEGGTAAFLSINIGDKEFIISTIDGGVIFPLNETDLKGTLDTKKIKTIIKNNKAMYDLGFRCKHYTAHLKDETTFRTSNSTEDRFEKGITDTIEIIFPNDANYTYYNLLSQNISIKMKFKFGEHAAWTFERYWIYYCEDNVSEETFNNIDKKENLYTELKSRKNYYTLSNESTSPIILLKGKQYKRPNKLEYADLGTKMNSIKNPILENYREKGGSLRGARINEPNRNLYHKIFENVDENLSIEDPNYKYRIEPYVRNVQEDNINNALAMTIHDPLWMLARQWQFGEFQGNDAGSVILAKLKAKKTEIDKLYSTAQPNKHIDIKNKPLEPLVEALPVEIDWQVKVESAHYFLSMLQFNKHIKNRQSLKNDLLTEFPLTNKENTHDDLEALKEACKKETQNYIAHYSKRIFDGYQLYKWCKEYIKKRKQNSKKAVFKEHELTWELFSEYAEWFENKYLLEENKFWKPEALNYSFGVSTTADDTQLVADNYDSGKVSWFSFENENKKGIKDASEVLKEESYTEKMFTFIPTMARYAGMPKKRLWELEKGTVDMGVSTGVGVRHYANALILQYATMYANDWMMLPMELDISTITDVDKVLLTNVFGDRTVIYSDKESSSEERFMNNWEMFTLSHTNPYLTNTFSSDKRMFYPPALYSGMESQPIEEIQFLRDEMSNMIWGVENVINQGCGIPLDGKHFAAVLEEKINETNQRHILPKNNKKEERAEYTYTFQNSVPANWIPFIPVKMENTTHHDRNIRLQRAKMPIHFKNDYIAMTPNTAFLKSGLFDQEYQPLFINEEEIEAVGSKLIKTYQRVRWIGGKTFTWMGYKKQLSGLKVNSNLKVDKLEKNR